MAAALIERVLHHCYLVNIRGNSYRMCEHVRDRQHVFWQPFLEPRQLELRRPVVEQVVLPCQPFEELGDLLRSREPALSAPGDEVAEVELAVGDRGLGVVVYPRSRGEW